ncbi:MAG: hypothetical protein SFU86_23520 [Pirellulaceae bacterium]|nr:hypothetical protein [Pirellulaceae bacterium]
MRCRAWLPLLLCLAIGLGHVAFAPAAEAPPLDQFLTRLGLSELRLHYLERSLAKAKPGPEQDDQARKLADAFAEQMLAAADDAERFARLKTRVEALLLTHPAANTPAIQVVLLQADYQRAEALMIAWLDDPANKTPLMEAAVALERLAAQLTTHHKDLAAAAEAKIAEIESLKTEAAKTAAEQEAARLSAISSRAAYFAGWSSYYLGVTKQNPTAAQPLFQAAKEMFLAVLDLSDEMNYEPIEAEGLGLESVWRTRAVIGLALAEISLNHPRAAGNCLAWLEHASVPPVLRDQAGYWHVQGLLNVGKYDEAVAATDLLVSRFSGTPSPGKNSLCIALIRAGAALPAERQAERRKLIEPGIRGLARMRQFDSLGQLLAKYKLDQVADEGSFYLTWLRGRQQFLAAEKTKAEADYRAALATLAAALAHTQAKTELTDAGQARYYWAWCHYRLGELETAAKAFQEATSPLRGALPELAVQSAWMQCVALQQLAAKDKKYVPPAMTALQTLRQDFPASEQAAKAEFALARLRQSGASLDEAIAGLAAIRPDDANYAAALYELCQLRHQLWTKAKADPAKAAPLADELLKVVDRFLAATAKEGDADRKLRATLLAVDALLAVAEPDLARVASYLRGAATAAEQAGTASNSAAEYHYRRLQLAQRTNDADTQADAARWIVANARGSTFELPALVASARAADQAVDAATAAERRQRVEAARAIYARLVELLGETPAALAGGKNALAAASKLAHYDELAGNWREAAPRLARLVAALPSDKRYLRRAGVAHYHAEDFPAALDCWRKLLGGLDSGSDDWLEAKYYQLSCLVKTDPPAAEKVWKQFKLLFPEVKSAAWQSKFAELGKQFH